MANEDTVRSTFGIASMQQPTKDFIAGVELEIESFSDAMYPGSWHIEEDGSLRNNGMEVISSPLRISDLVEGFKYVHRESSFRKPKEKFSDRTSIHVHINCLDLTQEQTKSMVLWYALFEPVFFAMVHPSRRNNIHCVGLDQTMLCEHYRRSLPLYVQRWSKYTALNLLPLQELGTIEFRHMEGHDDPERFRAWLKTLRNLWTYGQNNILGKGSVEPDAIMGAFDSIFCDSPIHGIRGSVLGLIGDNLVDIKLALL